MKVCCFPGTKPHDIIWRHQNSEEKANNLKNEIMSRLAEFIERKEVTHFICGITIPADFFSAELVLELKKTYPKITLECVLLFADQSAYWTKPEQKKFATIAKKAKTITILEETYAIKCHTLLTNYLVDKGDYFIGLLEGMSGYAIDTVMSAINKNKHVLIINPDHI